MTIPEPTKNPYLVLAAASVGAFMTMLDTTVVYIAAPRILAGLGATLDQGLWIIDGYILAFGVLLITAGRLGEIFGPRRVFILGLALFGVASVLSGAAPNVRFLVATRALQGLSAALVEPQAAVLIVGAFPKERIGVALGVFGAVLGLSALIGPTLGGFIVTNASWRWIFFLNVPLSALAIVMVRAFAPDLRPSGKPRLDLAGTLLLTVGLGAIVFALIEGERFAWGRAWGAVGIVHVLGFGLAVLVAFALYERVAKEPLLPASLFRVRNLTLMVLTAAGVDFALQGIIVTFSMCFQLALRMSPFETGLAFAPLALAGGVAAPITGRLVDRHGGRYVVGGGLLLFAVGALASAGVAQVSTSAVAFIPSMVLTGFGLAAVLGPVTAIIMGEVGAERAGTASGVLNTSRQIGSLLGTATLGSLLQNRLAANFAELLEIGGPLEDGDCKTAAAARAAQSLTAGITWGRDCSPAQQKEVERLLSHALTSAARPATVVAAVVLLVCAAATLSRFRSSLVRAR